ncbi:MAG TPA: regulatory protein RecX, partial [Coriobacteriia bacterium]|nr:regulatory protein RecX [Coriobacteriia bacterium]
IATPRYGQKRRTILLDESEWRTTSAAVVRALGLREADVVDAESLASAIDQAEPEAARERALRLLGSRERSAHELSRKLLDDGYPDGVVHAVVSRFRDCLLVDDSRFAESVARGAVEGRQLGRERILRTLADAGVDLETIERVVDAHAPAEGELARATALAQRFAARIDDPRKIAQRLIRKGFAPSVAFSAVRAVRDEDLGDDEQGL